MLRHWQSMLRDIVIMSQLDDATELQKRLREL